MIHLLLAIIYLAFISLGLPDGLLGAAWPTMYPEFGAPVSDAGIISMIIALGTILSSLLSDRLTFRLGTGRVTSISVGLSACALVGFSMSRSLPMLCLWAIPYGLAAGSVDASLNNYVALHYSSRHMSWLHCMWGIGASVGPSIMGAVLTGGDHWSAGYRYVALLQIGLTAILIFSLRLWKPRPGAENGSQPAAPLPLPEIVRIPGAREVLAAFFCYCALETTAAFWASSYLHLVKGVTPDQAAAFASMFFIGITAGRALNGFLTIKFSDTQLIRVGEVVIGLGIAAMLLPLGYQVSLVGLILIGLGCAPVYPCIIHSTPAHFGPERSQALIGVQMASAYTGTCLMPPLYGLIADYVNPSLLPVLLLAILVVMVLMYEKMLRRVLRAAPT